MDQINNPAFTEFSSDAPSAAANARLLIYDDCTSASVLTQQMKKRGYLVFSTHDLIEAKQIIVEQKPGFAIIEPGHIGRGRHLIPFLKEYDPSATIVIYTAYDSLAGAVDYLRRFGADDYLAKHSAQAQEIHDALSGKPSRDCSTFTDPTRVSPRRALWEYFQRHIVLNDYNINKTARQLGWHRRTLQRLAGKHAPRL